MNSTLIKPVSSEGKIIMGIDPGTTIMGFGLITIENKKPKIMEYGVVKLSQYSNQAIKLKKIYEKIIYLIDLYLPDEMAIEAQFFGKNVQSVLKLGRAQGVVMAAAISREIPIVEYAPKRIKQSVTGNGNASKEQVASMLQALLKFENNSQYFDATDALAIAYCHFNQNNVSQVKAKDWSSFIKENPGRVK